MTAPLAFDDYIAAHADGLLRHATIVTADPHTAQDVVQAVLERAYRRWPSIAALDHPDAYLHRMVINEFISLRRRLGRLLITDRLPDRAAAGADPADPVSNRDALMVGLRNLPPRQRAAVALRFWDGLGYAQIGEQLGCTEITARGYVHRAVKALRLDLVEPDDGGPRSIPSLRTPATTTPGTRKS